MSNEFQSSNILVDLDSILDTRLATLQRLGTDAVQNALNNDYFTRIADEFENIDFKAEYAKRDHKTLYQALVTPIISVINEFTQQTLTALVGSPFRRQPKLLLNIYPYQLDDQQTQAIVQGLAKVTLNTIDIEVVNLNPEEITPIYVKHNLAVMILYDYCQWLDIHSQNKNFLETQCPQVRLVVPLLLRSKNVIDTIPLAEAVDAVERYASLFIRLMFHPVQEFSVDIRRMRSQEK